MRRRIRSPGPSCAIRRTPDAKREALRLLARGCDRRAGVRKRAARQGRAARDPTDRRVRAAGAAGPKNCARTRARCCMDKSEYDDIQATSLTALTQFGGEAVANDEALLKSVDRPERRTRPAKREAERSPLPAEVRPVTGRSMPDLATAGAAVGDRASRHSSTRSRRTRSGATRLTDLLREDHPVLRPARDGDGRAHAGLGPARAGEDRRAGRRARLRARRARYGNRPLSRRGSRVCVALVPGNRLPAFAPFVMHALANIRYRDEPVSLDELRGIRSSVADATSPVVELLRTLAWLGPRCARNRCTELEPLGLPEGGLPRKRLADFDRALAAIRASEPVGDHAGETCCTLESSVADMFRRVSQHPDPASAAVESVVLRGSRMATRSGSTSSSGGQPSIVVFFYTRCDNPLKCSLTVTKLARVQKAARSAGIRRSDPHRSDHVRSRVSIFTSACTQLRGEPWRADGSRATAC